MEIDYLLRTDAPSTASANRKNQARKSKQRTKIDGIIHHPTYNIELCSLEAARSFIKRYNDEELNKASHLDSLKAIVRIENDLKALGFIEQKTPKKDDFKEDPLISEI
ncbi:8802_t:CDS:2 [Funneliformis mosseae]|uniref:8802_t:CDS:1 n=1 Tax=Funneliformis mosseae TaxID=27381 RepID=A0A9N8ZGS1_FUNMO|nr:8802_t:CDS:2 [Funneliformis mosseae]